ncbi:MAG: hypothetical protein QF400_03070, partial [Candidatus Peribacteraceae bacterium]|nr:hypothetical protein [Candidatus Peribacteraceae bacterium]
IKARFLHAGESEVLTTRFHLLSLLFAVIPEFIATVVLTAIFIVGYIYEWPMAWVGGVTFGFWFLFIFSRMIKSLIDWMFDFIMITTDKVLMVDQTSIFKREIKPIHLENIGGVSTETQFWDIFRFGSLRLHLKEGLGGQDLTKKYVPYAGRVAGILSDVVTAYQRRQPSQQKPATGGFAPAPKTAQPKVVTVG